MRLRLVPENTKLDFFKYNKFFYIVSTLLVLVSVFMISFVGLNYGIDFKGGTMIMTKTENFVPITDYRKALSDLNFGDISVTKISNTDRSSENLFLTSEENLMMIRVEQQTESDAIESNVVIALKDALRKNFEGIIFLQTDSVGSKVSAELIRAGFLAVILAVCGVLFYIWIRFEWQFALGSILALMHDIIITLGVFSILKLEFNLSIIAALLTIVGYSLNDTVIVFDRVRENLKRFKSQSLVTVLNTSINQTLGRTVMTSVTTLIALLSLYILGGEVIRGFTFAMIFGVLIGTFSSIFIASSLLLNLGVKRDWSTPSSGSGTQY